MRTLGLAVLLPLGACYCDSPGAPYCVADSEDELRQFSRDPTCATLVVQDTQLETLTGLEAVTDPLDVEIRRNARLIDVSAITLLPGAVTLENNTALTDAVLGIVGGVNVNDQNSSEFLEHQLQRLSLIASNIPLGTSVVGAPQRTTTDVVVTQNGDGGSSIESISVACDEARECLPLSLTIRARHGMGATLELDGVEYTHLSVTSENVALEDLQGLLVPSSSVSLSIVTRALAEAYLDWLIGEGFAGQFDACVFDGEVRPVDCNERVSFP